MTQSVARRAHGATIYAPDEDFAAGESPVPGDVGPRDAELTPGSSLGGRLWSGLRFGLGVLVVVGSSIAVAASAHRWALTSPRFALEKLELKGAAHRSPEQIRALAGISDGQNLFALDTRAVEARLLQDPWIETAKVVRQLPSSLKIEISERSARALALVGDRLYLVSQRSEPFKVVEPKDPVDLPVITGLNADNLVRDRRRELDRLGRALQVLAQYERLAMSRVYAAQEVHLADDDAVSLVIGREGLVLQLASTGLRQRLLMAERVVDETKRSGRLPGIVFADNHAHPERVVVRMR